MSMTSLSDSFEDRYEHGDQGCGVKKRPEGLKEASSLPPKWQLVWQLEELLGVELSIWGKKRPNPRKEDFQKLLDAMEDRFGVKAMCIEDFADDLEDLKIEDDNGGEK